MSITKEMERKKGTVKGSESSGGFHWKRKEKVGMDNEEREEI